MGGEDHGRRETTHFLWKEGVKPSDIHRRLSVVCENVPARSSVINWIRNSIRGKETAQAAVHEWYRNISKEWFRGVIWKLQRRWPRCIT